MVGRSSRDTRIATMSRSNDLPEMKAGVEPPRDEVDAARVQAEKRAEDATTEQEVVDLNRLQGRFDFTGASG